MEIVLWLVGYLAVCVLIGKVIAGGPQPTAGEAPRRAVPLDAADRDAERDGDARPLGVPRRRR